MEKMMMETDISMIFTDGTFIGGKNGDIDIDNMEVTRVVAKYKPVFEGDDSAKNKANQAKMPEEFAMYMKAKDLFTKKSIEAKQGFKPIL
jgi:hypothetical protein